MKFIIFAALFLYGFFYHITSSEFWPITISKTWFTPSKFEFSMLQKPLLTMVLSLAHLLPLSDSTHIYLVKVIFAFVGAVALTIFGTFLMKVTQFSYRKFTRLELASITAALVILISPLVRNNFFSIRSDQIAFLLFSAFLLFCEQQNVLRALTALLLIPLFGIKEVVFLIPGAIYFAWTFKKTLTPRIIFFSGLFALTILVWVIALNMDSASYLANSFAQTDYKSRFGINGYLLELPMYALSLISVIYIFLTRKRALYKLAVLGLVFTGLLLLLPQAYSFFIASVLLFALLPFFILLLQIQLRPAVKITILLLQFFWSLYFSTRYNIPIYESNFDQFKFINTAAGLISENRFSYLDGEGILPRQNFSPCFVSPYDDNANNSCLSRMKDAPADVLIVTSRLIFLGEEIFKTAEKNYEQIYPNFWVSKTKLTKEIRAKADLSNKNPLPIVIF